MEYQNGQPLPGRAPATAQRDPSKPNFQTSGYSTKPLTEQAKGSNRTKSSVRVRVEHVFGAQTNDMGGTLVRTIGMVRARAKIRMKNLTYNMRRLVQLRRINPCPA